MDRATKRPDPLAHVRYTPHVDQADLDEQHQPAGRVTSSSPLNGAYKQGAVGSAADPADDDEHALYAQRNADARASTVAATGPEPSLVLVTVVTVCVIGFVIAVYLTQRKSAPPASGDTELGAIAG